MEHKLRAGGVVATLSILVCVSTSAWAAPPQVPSLSAQFDAYVKYAVGDLPNHYKIGPVAATNNTPPDNPLTDAGATLGRVLFYDKRLSHGDGVACASCHKQATGFSDTSQFSAGINGQLTTRHSTGLANATYYANGRAFWDERAASLEAQALVPIESPTEMGATLNEVVAKLSQTAFYPPLFQAAFGSTSITPEKIGKAIAQFERSMVSYQSKYDTAFSPGQSQPNFAAVFTPQELAGEALFHGAGRCGACHTTNAHVSNGIHNTGLDAVSADPGAGNAQFKAPSLRNVAVRGRFMHDGRFSTLAEVIQFYSTGVQNNPNLDPIMRAPIRLNLTPNQVNQLVAYLNTLTDTTFLTSALFSDPFVTLPGDYSGDGIVGLEDYEIWSSSFGDTSLLIADGSGNGIVDAADYSVWRDNLGRTWSSASGAGAIAQAAPEPGGIILALLGLLAASCMRTRYRPPDGY